MGFTCAHGSYNRVSVFYLLKESLFSMSCGMFILHITFQRLCAASWCVHSEAQQSLVPA